jgi:hypothetical protein
MPLQPALPPPMQEVLSLDHPRFGHVVFLILVHFLLCLCRIRIRKRSPGSAVWVSQTKHHHQKNRNQHKATLDPITHLPTERDRVPALPKLDKGPLVQTKEATLQLVVVPWG